MENPHRTLFRPALQAANGRRTDDRPVWEPPIFDYSQYIGEEYEKQRKPVLEYYSGDVVQATRFLDLYAENGVLSDYLVWAATEGIKTLGSSKAEFYEGLVAQVMLDHIEVEKEFEELGVGMASDAELRTIMPEKFGEDPSYVLFDSRKIPPLQALEHRSIPTPSFTAQTDDKSTPSPVYSITPSFASPDTSSSSHLPTAVADAITLPPPQPHMQPALQPTETTALLSPPATSTAFDDEPPSLLRVIICGWHCI